MFNIPAIILHCKKLFERKNSIISQLDKYQFVDYSFYEDYDAIELTKEIINKFYKSKKDDFNNWEKKVLLWGKKALDYHPYLLNLDEISLTIKFGKVFQELSQKDFEHHIIFEDDVLLCDDFKNRFFDYLSKTPDDWDAIYFGSCVGLRPKKIEENKVAYVKEHPASRGADSILLRKKTICDLANSWFPFNLVSDWELGAQHYMHNHKVYWWEPSLVKQGSETGLFKSELR